MGFYLVPCFVAIYYLLAWLLVGRKRTRQSIAVRYDPPPGISPAAARYLYVMGCDGRTLAAILTQLAVRKLVSIVPRKDGTYLEDLTHDGHIPHELPPEEKLVFDRLARWRDPVRLAKPDQDLMRRITKAVQSGRCGQYISDHHGWVLAGLIATGLSTAWMGFSMGLFGRDPFAAWPMAAFTGLTVSMFSLVGAYAWSENRQALKLSMRGLYHRWTILLLLALILVFPSIWYLLMRTTAPEFGAVTLLLIFVNTLGAPELRNYTAAGRDALGQVMGFRQFLQAAEQDRLDRLNPPGSPVQADERYLPYAIALDVREAWGDDLGVRTMAETAF